jgi:hypothetical protein
MSGSAAPAGRGPGTASDSDWRQNERHRCSGAGNWNQNARPQPGDAGVPAHHLRIRQDVRTANVEGAVDVGGQRRGADKIAQDITDGDGLDAVLTPFRGDHHWQALGDMMEHLERRRPAADDQGSLQRGRRHATAQQDILNLPVRAQVR